MTNPADMHSDKALVLFSGGQDSTTCLAWALARYPLVETIGFDYGQRHRVELDCRLALRAALRDRFAQWAHRLGDDHLLDLTLLGQISDTALTRDVAIEMQANGLPSTFVPGRNLVFLTFAAAVAYRRGLSVLVGGMCETDYSGYPDCRDTTIKAMQAALRLGLDRPLVIETPLMWIDKAATWQLAHTLGGDALVRLIIDDSHSCYLGDRSLRHEWGFGCGQCPACTLRASGYTRWTSHAEARDTGDNPRVTQPARESMPEAEVIHPDRPADSPAEAAVPDPAQLAVTLPVEPQVEPPGDLPAAAPSSPPPVELSPAACARRLAEMFPALFGPDGPPKPIKLRIQADLQLRAPGVFSKRALGLFLSRHTTTTAYLKGLVHAPHRFDLDGQPAGEISEIHRTAATEELARRRGVVDARRAAERDSHRAAEQEARRAQVADDSARRDRAALLRTFETSTLTKANFCALKRINEAELDATLAQARQEREERPPMPPQEPRSDGPGRREGQDRPPPRPQHPQNPQRPHGAPRDHTRPARPPRPPRHDG